MGFICRVLFLGLSFERLMRTFLTSFSERQAVQRVDPRPIIGGDVETFVMKNFMRTMTAANLVHIYHYLHNDEDFNCENLARVIGDQTGRLPEIERFVALCLFDALIGNHDRHGRNLALIQTKKGLRVSPFYDNPSYIGVEDEALLGAQLEPRGKIVTKETNEPTIRHYATEFIRIGYEDAVRHFYRTIQLDRLTQLVDQSFLSERRKAAIVALIHRRFKEFTDALEK